MSLYISGFSHQQSWNEKAKQHDIFSAKGIADYVLQSSGCSNIHYTKEKNCLLIKTDDRIVGNITEITAKKLLDFDIKQPVYFVDFKFEKILHAVAAHKIIYKEVPKFLALKRDLAMIISNNILI